MIKKDSKNIRILTIITVISVFLLWHTNATVSLTEYVDPNGDSTPLEGTPTPGGTHYTTIDEGTRQPDAGDDSDYIALNVPCDNTLNTTEDVLDMSSIVDVGEVTQIVLWVYSSTAGCGMGMNSCSAEANINFDGWKTASDSIYITGGPEWRSITYSGLSGDQTNLDNLQISVAGVASCDPGVRGPTWTYQIFSAYAEVTYTEGGSDEQPAIFFGASF